VPSGHTPSRGDLGTLGPILSHGWHPLCHACEKYGGCEAKALALEMPPPGATPQGPSQRRMYVGCCEWKRLRDESKLVISRLSTLDGGGHIGITKLGWAF